ncbi:class I SAM-dependent methyltransferase [Dehalococcoidia bacterium]|nr:class I SAM-dependent methyltransferase [Dehalococcoidia bacterium]
MVKDLGGDEWGKSIYLLFGAEAVEVSYGEGKEMGMIFGREYWRHPQIFLNLLSKGGISRSISPKLEALLKAYVMLWGIPHPSFQLRAAYFQRFTKRIQFSRALDAGCGIGLHSILLARKYPYSRIDAYDIDSELITVAKEVAKELHLDNLYFIEQDLLKLQNFFEYDFI